MSSIVICVEEITDLLVTWLPRSGKQSPAGIVDQNVQFAEVGVCPLNCLLDLRSVIHVESERQGCVAEAFFISATSASLRAVRFHLIAAFESGFSPDAAEITRGHR